MATNRSLEEICPICKGSGKIGAKLCQNCQGTGNALTEEGKQILEYLRNSIRTSEH
jgi:DnaJ-class molecular chaperone